MTSPDRTPVRRLFRWLPSLRRVEREIDDELRFHFDSRINDLITAGHGADEAHRIAAAEYGDVDASRAELAATDRRMLARERRADWLDVIRQDVSYAARSLRRRPGFTIGVALTLALAVGANGAVFSLIDPLLFRAPPGVVDPNAVVRLYANFPKALWAVDGRAVGEYFSYPAYLALRDAAAGVARVAAYRPCDSSAVRRGSDSTFANVAYATASFLPTLGARIARGRTFTEREDDVDAPAPVCVVSDAFARRALGGPDASLGQSIVVRDAPCTVIGVAAAGFQGIDVSATDIWAPFSGQPRSRGSETIPWYRTGDTYIPIIARLEHGAEMRELVARGTVALARSLERPVPSYEGRTLLAGPIVAARGPMAESQQVVIGTRLAVVAAIVLLIACANVANLYLVRAIRRRREIAVRLALGVSRRRLASQFFIEGLLMASIAGAAALVVAGWAGGALRAALLPRVHWIGAALTLKVFAYSVLCALGASLVAAIVPAILSSRPELVDSLRAGVRDGVVTRSPIRSVLLAAQAALSVVLIVGAALFVQSLQKVRTIDLGFDAKQVMLGTVFFPDGGPHPERATLLPEIATHLAGQPGVRGATYASGGPFTIWSSGVPLFVPGRDSSITGRRSTDFVGVAPGYFEVMRTRIIAGRGFSGADRRESVPVMVVSDQLAKTYWPRESPIGKCVIPDEPTNPCFLIVGVAQDVHQFSLVQEAEPHFYVPLEQVPLIAIHQRPRTNRPAALYVTADVSMQSSVMQVMRAELTREFPGARVRVATVTSVVAPQLAPWKLGARLFGALGVLSLLVAAVGIYSVVSFSVQQRTHEMGVRIALGARRGDLLRLVIGRVTVLIAAGVAFGIVAALLAGRFIASLLYGVSSRDPVAAASSAGILFVVGLAASLIPAFRASRLDPSVVLREDGG